MLKHVEDIQNDVEVLNWNILHAFRYVFDYSVDLISIIIS